MRSVDSDDNFGIINFIWFIYLFIFWNYESEFDWGIFLLRFFPCVFKITNGLSLGWYSTIICLRRWCTRLSRFWKKRTQTPASGETQTAQTVTVTTLLFGSRDSVCAVAREQGTVVNDTVLWIRIRWLAIPNLVRFQTSVLWPLLGYQNKNRGSFSWFRLCH